MGLGEEDLGLVDIARTAPFDQHSSPREVGPSGEEFSADLPAESCCADEVGIRLLVAPKDGSKVTVPASTISGDVEVAIARSRATMSPVGSIPVSSMSRVR